MSYELNPPRPRRPNTMDTRSTRYRSLDSTAAVPAPRTRDRHNSVPTVDRRKDQPPKRQPATSKSPEVSHHRVSKSSPRDDSLTSPDRRTTTRHLDRHPGSGYALEARSVNKVRRPILVTMTLAGPLRQLPVVIPLSHIHINPTARPDQRLGFHFVHKSLGRRISKLWQDLLRPERHWPRTVTHRRQGHYQRSIVLHPAHRTAIGRSRFQ